MRTLILGASGGIGKYVVDYLINTVGFPKNQLWVASRHSIPFFAQNKLQWIPVDVANKESFALLPEAMDVVIDLAGMMPARMEGYHPQSYIDVNITGTLNVLEYCRRAHVDRLMFTQSFGDIKDNAEQNVLLKPDSPRHFRFDTDHTVYVLSKNFAVDLIENYHQMYGLKNFIFRLPTVHSYSPIDYFYLDGIKRPIGYRLLINKASVGEDIEVYGDATRMKDMVYVKDLAQMFYKAMTANCDGGIYNVGTGVGTSLLDQIKGMVDVFSPRTKPSKIIMCPDKPNAPQYVMDIENAKRDLGYEPKYMYKDMLMDILKERELNRF